MFTGIIEEVGEVVEAGTRTVIACSKVGGDADVGASVAVNGVCLTVVERETTGGGRAELGFDLSEETLSRTSLGSLRRGAGVNLERPVTLLSRLGGHLVQGHVDGAGLVAAVEPRGTGAVMTFEIPAELRRFVVEKGSVAVDGVSLTATAVEDERFSVALIPHTLAATTLGDRAVGDRVNIEVDMVAKYIAGFVRAASGSGGRRRA
jgi:riboflavin synthase